MLNTERDELAADIRGLGITVVDGPPVDLTEPLAQHLHNLGYRKPRTIPDEHLRQSRDGSYPVKHNLEMIIQSADGSVWRFDLGDWDLLGWRSAALRGPAVVLYEGSQS